MNVFLLVYLAGALWGLLRSDASPVTRAVLALSWPIGPIAFAVVIAILLASMPIAFPVVGTSILTAAGAAWWFLP